MGELSLSEFDAELVARGFDAYDQTTRWRYINWGYRRIARRARWLWEQTSVAVIMNPGDWNIGVTTGPVDGTHPIGNFKAITRMGIQSPDSFRRKIRPMSDEEFYEQWWPLNLSQVQNRGTPEAYLLEHQGGPLSALFIVPPPATQVTIGIAYKQQVALLAAGGDKPITPPDLDEAILVAALARAHSRANEIQLEQQRLGQLEEIFSEMATDEEFEEEERQDRVEPDDQWL